MYLHKTRKVYYADFVVGGKRHHYSLDTDDPQVAKRLESNAKAKAKANLLDKPVSPTTPPKFIPDWMKAGGFEDKSTMSLSQAFHRMCAEVWDRNKDSANPRIHVRRVIEIIGDIQDLREFSTTHVAKIVETLEEEGKSGATINKYLTSLFVIFNRANDVWEPKVIDKVISWKAFKQRKKSGRRRVFSERELNIMYEYFLERDEREMYLFVKILRHTGMRKGELHRITLKDVDLPRRELVSLENKEGDRPKYIPLNEEAYKAVRELVEMRIKEHYGSSFDAANPSKNALMSSKVHLVSLTSNQTEDKWRRMKAQSKLKSAPEVVMHALRHTFASDLVNKGVSIYVIKELLGHSSVDVTKIYTHVNNSTLHNAVNL